MAVCFIDCIIKKGKINASVMKLWHLIVKDYIPEVQLID